MRRALRPCGVDDIIGPDTGGILPGVAQPPAISCEPWRVRVEAVCGVARLVPNPGRVAAKASSVPNPEGLQKIAGGRSAAETSGYASRKSGAPRPGVPDEDGRFGYAFWWNKMQRWRHECAATPPGSITQSGRIPGVSLLESLNPRLLAANPDGFVWVRCEVSPGPV